MPVKRRASKHCEFRLTPEAVDAFKAGDDTALRRALGLRPWQWPTCPPLDEASCYSGTSEGAKWWPVGQELHRELIAAGAQIQRKET